MSLRAVTSKAEIDDAVEEGFFRGSQPHDTEGIYELFCVSGDLGEKQRRAVLSYNISF